MARKPIGYTEQDIIDYMKNTGVSRKTACAKLRYRAKNPLTALNPSRRHFDIEITDEEILALATELSITASQAKKKIYQQKIYKKRQEESKKIKKILEPKVRKEKDPLALSKRVSVWYTYEEIMSYMQEHNVSRSIARNRIKTAKKKALLPPTPPKEKIVKPKLPPKKKSVTGSKYATEAEIAQYIFETGKTRHDAIRYWRLVRTNRPVKEARALLVKMGFTEEDSFIVVTQKEDNGDHRVPEIPYGYEYWFKNPTTLLWAQVMLDNSHLDKIFPLNK